LYFRRLRDLGKVTKIRGIPSPQPSPTGEGAGCSRFCGCRRFEKQLGFTVDFRSSEKQKAASTTYFSCRTLNPNSHPVLPPRGRELERGQQAARLVFGGFRYWERLPPFWECPLPSPPPRGRERVAADFAVSGGLKSNLGLQPLISGRLKRKKAARTTCFPCRTFNPNSCPVLSPRGREPERGQQAARLVFGAAWGIGKGCRNSVNALSPALPHGGGSRLQRIQALQVV